MNKKLQLFCLTLFSSVLLTAQTKQKTSTCGTEAPPQQWDEWFNKQVEIYKENLQMGKTQSVSHTIPIIVHVVHFGEAVGTYPNIDSNQVVSQIPVLNKDFEGTGFHTDSIPAIFSNLVANTGIRFCLAQKNPNGGVLVERGIDRVNAASQGWQNPNTPTINLQSYIETFVKPNTVWDPIRYLNIWISDRPATETLNGFSTYPAGTNLSGLFGGTIGTAQNDGIWIWTKAFGTIGTVVAPYNKGRTCTHEMGHWLGLRHIWGDGNCLSDYCNDTPYSKLENTGCLLHPSYINRCGVGLSPNGEMFMNFMDGTNDACKNMFTNGQNARMQTALSQCTYRNLLGTHNLCGFPAAPSSSAIASFSLAETPCVGNSFTPFNMSVGEPQPSFVWSSVPPAVFNPAPSVPNPGIVFNTGGNYTLTLVATNSISISTYTLAINGVTTCPVVSQCIDTIKIIKNTDFLVSYKDTVDNLTLGCQSGFTGFLTGTNCFKEKEFAQFFPPSSYTSTPYPQVNSVIVLFDSSGTKASSPTSGTQIICRLYGGSISSGPGGQLQQIGDSLVNIASATRTNSIKYLGSPTYSFATAQIIPYKFDFPAPVLINNLSGFYASVQAPYFSPSDSIKIFSNAKSNLITDSSSWYLQYNGSWRTFRTFKKAKIHLAIIPQITCSSIVGIKEEKTNFNSNITIVPNPSNGLFSLIFTLPKEEELYVKIYNSVGQQISSEHLQNVSNNLINIDLSDKPEGIYFTEISNGTERVVKKLIINH